MAEPPRDYRRREEFRYKNNRSTVNSGLNHSGAIDERSLEIPHRRALVYRIREEDTNFSGIRMTVYAGGRHASPPVTFIGPAGDTRFNAGASLDMLAVRQAVRPRPSLPAPPQDNTALPEMPNLTLQNRTQENSVQTKLPPADAMEVESPRFSPLFCMAYGGGENEVDEFGDANADGDSEEFLMEEYDFDELEE